MDKRGLRRTLKDLKVIFHMERVDRDAVTRCAEELYWALRVTPCSVWQAPRQVSTYQTMLARHDLREPEVPRCVALALARRWPHTPVEVWQEHISEWGCYGILSLCALPPAVRVAYLQRDDAELERLLALVPLVPS